jgi:hypothetical protein
MWSVLPSRIDFQQAETGYDLTHFSIEWERQTLTCPQGHSSSSWTPAEACQRPTRHQGEILAIPLVKPVPVEPLAPEQLGAPSPCSHESGCRPCLRHANARVQTPSKTPIAIVQALRGSIHKACAPWDDVVRATLACPKRIWPILPSPPRSMSCN